MLRRDPRTETYRQLLAIAENAIQGDHANAWEQVLCSVWRDIALFGPPCYVLEVWVVVQEQRHHVSGLCLEAAAVREGRGVAQMTAKLEAMSGVSKTISSTALSDGRQAHTNTRVQRRTDGRCYGNGIGEARSYVSSSASVCAKLPRNPLVNLSASNKRPLQTQSPHPVHRKRPALALIQECSGGGSPTERPGTLLGCGAAGLTGSRVGGGRPQCLVVKHVGTTAEITPAWQQAINESQVKAKHDEDSENRATELSRKMEQLGKEAVQRVSRAKCLRALEHDIAAHDARKCAERLAVLSRSRRTKLQRSSTRSGGPGRVYHQDASGLRMTQQVDNERVRRSVYCRAGAGGRQEPSCQTTPSGHLPDPGTGTRHPLGELEPGFFGHTGR